MAIPALLAGVVEPLISLTDTVVAGRLPQNSDLALGALGLVGSFLSALVWIFLQTANAISALVSQGVGSGRIHRLKALISQVLVVNLFLSLMVSLLGFIFAREIFLLYGASGGLLDTCITYFRIRVWGFPFTLTSFTLFGIFQGLQNTSIAMKISVFGGILNLILDVLFVFIFHWDVQGIALASLLVQGTICFLAIQFLLCKTPFGFYRILPIHPDFSRTMSMSFDLFLRTLALNFALFLAMRFATLLGSHGDDRYVAAHALLVQLWLFSSYFLDGYAHAGTAISGKLLGALDYTRLRYLVVDLLKVMVGMGVILGGVYYIFQEFLVEFFTVSPRVQMAFLSVFWVVACMQPLNAVAFLMDGIYKGIGETKVLRNVLTTAVFFSFIPALFLFYYYDWGLLGIWLSFVIWMLYRGGLLSLHFFLKYLKSKGYRGIFFF